MEKRAVALAVLMLFLLAAFAYAQEDSGEEQALEEEQALSEDAGITPDSPLYVLDTFIDDISVATKSGSAKTEEAMRVKNERIAEAAEMVKKNDAGSAVKALNNAGKSADIVEDNKFSPNRVNDTEQDVKKSIQRLDAIKAKLPNGGFEGVEKAINAQLTQEEKIRAAKDFIKTIGDYCEGLAYEDMELMKDDPMCSESKAPEWLKEYIESDLKAREDDARKLIIDQVTTCVLNPRECDCNKIPVRKHRNECEVNKELAIKCEYNSDMAACNKLDEQKPEAPEDLPDSLRPIFESTMKDAISKKEKEMFEKFRPPECSQVSTPRECYDIMKGLYGTPPECEGLSDDDCFKKMKEQGPPKESEFPAECKEAGAKSPVECSKIMFEKYGKPPWCEGLSDDDCVKESMKHGKGEDREQMKSDFPDECREAGATKPRDCFDIMTQKHGLPRECKDLSADECFKQEMRRGPGERKEMEIPPECKDLSPDECRQKMGGSSGFGGGQALPQECEGVGAEECFEKMRDKYGVPEECKDLDKNACESLMQSRGSIGRPGSMPPECEGLSPEECFSSMVNNGKIPECQGISPEECRNRMQEEHGKIGEGGERAGSIPPGCEGLSPEECRQKMQESGRESGSNNMDNRFNRQGRPDDCEGLGDDECRQRMQGREGEQEINNEHNNPEGRRDDRGSREGMQLPSECEGISPEECSSKMAQKGMQQNQPIERRQMTQPQDNRRFQQPFDGRSQPNQQPTNEIRSPETGQQAPFSQPNQQLPSEPRVEQVEQVQHAEPTAEIQQTVTSIVGQVIRDFSRSK
ncbi:hypothetical protein HYY72_02505 [Candidatus Woesearchaeota archaeon]|nr:hypothetical protein [Candidatus Woesearchaeota archaeon]